MKKLANILITISISVLACFLILEVFFRVAIPAAERPNVFFDEAFKLAKYDANAGTGLYTIGFDAHIQGLWSINNHGWNASYDFVKKENQSQIAVIGDSFVEGFQVDVDKRFVEIINNKFTKKGVNVMAFGRAGAPLSQYLHMARYVKKVFNPDVYIFNIVSNDFDLSVARFNLNETYFLRISNNEDGSFGEENIIPYNSLSKSFWKKSALIRYLYYNARIGIMIGSWLRNMYVAEDINDYYKFRLTNLSEIERVANYVVTQLKEELSPAKLLFVMDAARPCIYDNKECNDTLLFNMFENICITQQEPVINMAPVMKKHFQLNGQPFEFDIDNHWNELGHSLVAEQVINFLVDSLHVTSLK
jgi:hypothetical protein